MHKTGKEQLRWVCVRSTSWQVHDLQRVTHNLRRTLTSLKDQINHWCLFLWVKPIWSHLQIHKRFKLLAMFALSDVKQVRWGRVVLRKGCGGSHRCLSISVYPSSEEVATIFCYKGIIEDDGNWTFFLFIRRLLVPLAFALCLLMSTQRMIVFVHESSLCSSSDLEAEAAMKQSELRSWQDDSSSCNTGTATCAFHAWNWCGGTKAKNTRVHPPKNTATSLCFTREIEFLTFNFMDENKTKQHKSISCSTVAG